MRAALACPSGQPLAGSEIGRPLLRVALAVNRVCTWFIRGCVGDLTPPPLAGAVHYLQNLPSVFKIILALFLVDFLIYWIHRAQHRFDLLWRTHAWHHSIEQMYWFSGFRTSFLHSFIYNIPQVIIPVTLFKLSPAEAGIGYSLGLLIQFWEHTNLNVNVGRLAWLIITPAYHRIHHSATVHRGKNLGTFQHLGPDVRHVCRPEQRAGNLPARAGRTSRMEESAPDVIRLVGAPPLRRAISARNKQKLEAGSATRAIGANAGTAF